MHLQPDELVDLAEGTQAESSAPHLAACEACRRQLKELKAMMSVAADVEAPEPSPLFWDHFSNHVRDAIAAEGAPRRSLWTWPRLVLPVAAVALAGIVLMVALNNSRLAAPPTGSEPVASKASLAIVEPLSDLSAGADDSALTLVAELSSDLDFDSAREAGLAVGGSADHAVTHLNGGELRELQRLLQEELARSGA